MPRTKKVYRGRGRGNSNRGLYRNGNSYVPPSVEIPNDYSMQQEALDTQRHNSRWNTERGLRHRNVNFVSAGAFDQSNLTDPSAALAKMTLVDVDTEIHENGDQVQDDSSLTQGPILSEMHKLMTDNPHEQPDIFVIDTRGDQSLVSNFAPPQIRSPSPTLSVSSEEVILFAGRDRAGRGISRRFSGSNNTDFCDPPKKTIETRVNEQQTLLAGKKAKAEDPHAMQEDVRYGRSVSSIEINIEPSSRDCCNDLELQPEGRCLVDGVRTSQSNSGSRSPWSAKRDDTQLIIDDYITNIEEQGLDLHTVYNHRDLGGTDSDACRETDASFGEASQESFRNDRSHPGLDISGDMSPCNDTPGNVKAILSKRNGKAGIQYLVVWDGKSMNDTNWVSTSRLIDPRSIRLVEQYEVDEKRLAPSYEDEIGSGLYMDENSTGDEDVEASDDDMDPAQRRIDHMTDEKIARLLAKQEELGLGSTEILLFDDSPEAGIDDDIMSFRGVPRLGRTGQRNQVSATKSRTEFLATAASTDAYDGFDVMDFERPSLKKKPKSHRDKLTFDVSDSELEASMQLAWENDWSQKRQRREERQELRVQGLLGAKRAKPDVKNMYQEGMTLDDVKKEIRNFLLSDTSTLALPPMDKADRRVVHEIAHEFNINSRSAGKGNKRFPVLYRTSRTSSYDESKFAAVEARLRRRFLPRMDAGRGNHRWVAKRSGRGGFAHAAVSYRDGDIVGGSAPELGTDNKGRAMLEKMGWSTGTALGAVNNKGILQPVSHVVKTTKAGLG